MKPSIREPVRAYPLEQVSAVALVSLTTCTLHGKMLILNLGRKLGEMQLRIFITLIVWNFHLEPTPASLSSFSKHEELTTCPQQCYLRLAELP